MSAQIRGRRVPGGLDDLHALVDVVSLTHGWGRRLFHPETRTTPEEQGTNANLLTGDENLDELCGMPVFNAILCAVRPDEE